MIEEKVYARIGLLGNPSDGFRGKTIACTIKNFYAIVKLEKLETENIEFIPHPKLDNLIFSDIHHLNKHTSTVGYSGARSLLLATVKKFHDLAIKNSWRLHKNGCKISYDTTIPRQVGLSGSSALITALTKCLIKFYKVQVDQFPIKDRPTFVLKVETEELDINAGLMDRVVQIYEGCVYMDFSEKEPKYFPQPTKIIHFLDQFHFFLAYLNSDKDSGKVHNNVKNRFLSGDSVVVEAMKSFGGFAFKGKNILEKLDSEKMKDFGQLMNINFDLRRQIYKDSTLGKENIRLIDIARKNGAFCKFSGSGGAIFGFLEKYSKEQMTTLRVAYEKENYNFEELKFQPRRE